MKTSKPPVTLKRHNSLIKKDSSSQTDAQCSARIHDLRPEDKVKVSRLLKQVVTIGQECAKSKETTIQCQHLLKAKDEDLRNVASENCALKKKLKDLLIILQTYQQKVRFLEEELSASDQQLRDASRNSSPPSSKAPAKTSIGIQVSTNDLPCLSRSAAVSLHPPPLPPTSSVKEKPANDATESSAINHGRDLSREQQGVSRHVESTPLVEAEDSFAGFPSLPPPKSTSDPSPPSISSPSRGTTRATSTADFTTSTTCTAKIATSAATATDASCPSCPPPATAFVSFSREVRRKVRKKASAASMTTTPSVNDVADFFNADSTGSHCRAEEEGLATNDTDPLLGGPPPATTSPSSPTDPATDIGVVLSPSSVAVAVAAVAGSWPATSTPSSSSASLACSAPATPMGTAKGSLDISEMELQKQGDEVARRQRSEATAPNACSSYTSRPVSVPGSGTLASGTYVSANGEIHSRENPNSSPNSNPNSEVARAILSHLALPTPAYRHDASVSASASTSGAPMTSYGNYHSNNNNNNNNNSKNNSNNSNNNPFRCNSSINSFTNSASNTISCVTNSNNQHCYNGKSESGSGNSYNENNNNNVAVLSAQHPPQAGAVFHILPNSATTTSTGGIVLYAVPSANVTAQVMPTPPGYVSVSGVSSTPGVISHVPGLPFSPMDVVPGSQAGVHLHPIPAHFVPVGGYVPSMATDAATPSFAPRGDAPPPSVVQGASVQVHGRTANPVENPEGTSPARMDPMTWQSSRESQKKLDSGSRSQQIQAQGGSVFALSTHAQPDSGSDELGEKERDYMRSCLREMDKGALGDGVGEKACEKEEGSVATAADATEPKDEGGGSLGRNGSVRCSARGCADDHNGHGSNDPPYVGGSFEPCSDRATVNKTSWNNSNSLEKAGRRTSGVESTQQAAQALPYRESRGDPEGTTVATAPVPFGRSASLASTLASGSAPSRAPRSLGDGASPDSMGMEGIAARPSFSSSSGTMTIMTPTLTSTSSKASMLMASPRAASATATSVMEEAMMAATAAEGVAGDLDDDVMDLTDLFNELSSEAMETMKTTANNNSTSEAYCAYYDTNAYYADKSKSPALVDDRTSVPVNSSGVLPTPMSHAAVSAGCTAPSDSPMATTAATAMRAASRSPSAAMASSPITAEALADDEWLEDSELWQVLKGL